MTDLHIADLSDFQPGVNFADYASGGRPGVFLKATEGLGFVASTFHGYRAAAHAAGLVFVGAYHFAKGHDPQEEANHFLATIGWTLQPGEVAVLDAEVAGLSADWCRTWLRAVQTATGREPLLYCSWSYWSDVLSSMTDCPLWIAAYHGLGHNDPRDSVPGCRFWQYSDRADVPGVGSADDSVFRGTADDLAAMAGSPTPTQPAPEDDMFSDQDRQLLQNIKTDLGTGSDDIGISRRLSDTEGGVQQLSAAVDEIKAILAKIAAKVGA